MKKIVTNGVEQELTDEEYLATIPNAPDAEAELAAQQAAAEAKATAQANGNQKLLDLGLTQEEATALTGYTPPSE